MIDARALYKAIINYSSKFMKCERCGKKLFEDEAFCFESFIMSATEDVGGMVESIYCKDHAPAGSQKGFHVKKPEFKDSCDGTCKELCCPSLKEYNNVYTCGANDIMECKKFVAWKKTLDDARASGKQITVRITDDGMKFLKRSLYYWMMKGQYDKIIGEFYGISESNRQELLEKLLEGLHGKK